MNAKKLYQKPDNIDDIIYKNGDTTDIISVIKMADEIAAQKRYSKEFAIWFQNQYKKLSDYELIRELFAWHKAHIKYVGDEPGFERVKLPHKTMHDGFADCKSDALHFVDICRELGFYCEYKYVAWKASNPIKHVYGIVHLKNRKVIADVVHDRFDEEVKPYFNEILVPMTKIALVRGIQGVDDEHPLLANRPFMNYHIMTEAELATQIYLENLKLEEAVYPDKARSARKAIEYIENAIYKGIHGLSGNLYISGNDPALLNARQFLEYHRNNFSGACTHAFDESRRRGSDRSSGIDPQILGLDLETDLSRCYDKKFSTRTLKLEDPTRDEVDLCSKQTTYKKIINDSWEQGAHHLLYEFIPNPNIYAATVAAKAIDHKKIIPETGRISGLSHTNLQSWAALGVKRMSATKDIGLLSPEETIKELFDARYKDENGAYIGDGGISIILILIIIAVATPALAGLIQVMKGQEPTAFQYMEKALSTAVAASNRDFDDGRRNGGGGGGNNDDEDNTGDDFKGDDDKNPPVGDGISIKVISQPADGGSVTGGGDYDKNDSFTLTALPNTGFTFTGYLKNGIIASTEAFFSGKATKDETYIATFKKTDDSKVNKFLDGMSTGEKVGAAAVVAAVSYFAFIKE
jgi:Divergent InlB B-repeat domain